MSKSTHKPFKFLGWLAPLVFILAILWRTFEPTGATIKSLWPIWSIAVLVGITAAFLKFGGDKIQEVLKTDWVKKLGSGFLVVAVFIALWTIFQHFAADYLSQKGWTPTETSVVLAFLAPFIVYAIWELSSGALPGKPGTMAVATFFLALCWLTVEGYDHYKTDKAKKEAAVAAQKTKAEKIQKWQWSWIKKGKSGKSGPLFLVLKNRKILHFKGKKGSWIVLNKQSDGIWTGNWKDPHGNTGVITKLKFTSSFYAEGISIGKEGDVASAKLVRLR